MVQFIFKHKPQQKLHGIVVGSEAIDAQIKDVLRISIISIRLYKKSLKKYSILFRNRRVSTCAQLQVIVRISRIKILFTKQVSVYRYSIERRIIGKIQKTFFSGEVIFGGQNPKNPKKIFKKFYCPKSFVRSYRSFIYL